MNKECKIDLLIPIILTDIVFVRIVLESNKYLDGRVDYFEEISPYEIITNNRNNFYQYMN